MTDTTRIECDTHGPAYKTYVCEHLVNDPRQEWFSREPEEGNLWPDAWCSDCDAKFMSDGEWNENNHCRIVLLCHHCYEDKRSQGTWAETDDASTA